jgi:DNA polymerase IV
MTELPINPATPRLMHIDINSCFATIEQQANPLLRGKPVVVAAYTTPNAIILAPSIEAKKYGIKVGHSVREGKQMCPKLIVKEPDPPKYRMVHKQFIKILMDYSAKVIPKSIDEALIDFNDPALFQLDLVCIAKEIKQRIRSEIGDWMSCNVGIGTNRFLAKTAAGLHKPDGLDVITHTNLIDVYKSMELLDICGINTRYQRRLNNNAIFTPLEFFYATQQKLHKSVFKSIMGYHWYYRLRGWEADNIEFERKSIGHSYSLHHKTDDQYELSRILMKMCEKVGRRLRSNNLVAKGIYLSCAYTDHDHFHQSHTYNSIMYSSQDLYKHAQKILDQQPEQKVVRQLAVGCFGLQPTTPHQLELFSPYREHVVKAVDSVNDRFGEFIVTTARMMDTEKEAPDRIAFGKVRDMNYD